MKVHTAGNLFLSNRMVDLKTLSKDYTILGFVLVSATQAHSVASLSHPVHWFVS